MGTKINYLDETWNPVAMRCDPCSDGCLNCWHLRMCKRHAANPALPPELRVARAGGPFCLMVKELFKPVHWNKPRTVGVQFMGDLFHEKVPDDWIRKIWGVMTNWPCRKHTFMVLTKRPENILAFRERKRLGFYWGDNVWLGVTAEDQPNYDARWSLLRKVEAEHLWVSAEPLLGSLCIEKIGWRLPDFVVVGPEVINGRPGRPCKIAWIRSIVDQCHAVGVPVHVKAAPLGKKIITDLDGISAVLDLPPEQLRQWPTVPGERKEGERK